MKRGRQILDGLEHEVALGVRLAPHRRRKVGETNRDIRREPREAGAVAGEIGTHFGLGARAQVVPDGFDEGLIRDEVLLVATPVHTGGATVMGLAGKRRDQPRLADSRLAPEHHDAAPRCFDRVLPEPRSVPSAPSRTTNASAPASRTVGNGTALCRATEPTSTSPASLEKSGRSAARSSYTCSARDRPLSSKRPTSCNVTSPGSVSVTSSAVVRDISTCPPFARPRKARSG